MRIIARCDFLPMSHQIKVLGNGEFQFSFVGGSLGQCLIQDSYEVGVGHTSSIFPVKVEQSHDIMISSGGFDLGEY